MTTIEKLNKYKQNLNNDGNEYVREKLCEKIWKWNTKSSTFGTRFPQYALSLLANET